MVLTVADSECCHLPCSLPPYPVGSLNAYHLPFLTAQAQFGGTEKPIHDVVRRAKTVIHQLAIALRANHEQRRQFTLGDPGRELDIDLPAVVEGSQWPPRRPVTTQGIPETQPLQ